MTATITDKDRTLANSLNDCVDFSSKFYDEDHAAQLIANHVEERVRELEADRKRLDWLEAQGKPETFEEAPHSTVWVLVGDLGQSNIREAIDAAMKAAT